MLSGLGLEGIRFRLHYRDETLHVKIPLIGRHSVHTALRAAAVGLAEGMNWQEILEGLSQGHTQLRLAAVRSQTGALLLDDTYNASPESMLAALNLLDELDGRKVAVLGDMLELGPYERGGHEMVGLRAAQVASVLLTLGERAHMIAEAARRAGMKKNSIVEFDDFDPLMEWFKANLTSNDSVLIKGFSRTSHGSHHCNAGGTFVNQTTFVLSLAMLSFVMTVIWGPPLLRVLRHFKIGKMIRVDEPGHHNVKMGTPTMGGVLFILPVLLLTGLLECGELIGLK